MEPAEVIEALRGRSGFFEIYHLHSAYKCYRTTTAGEVQQVSIEIYDAGPQVQSNIRYHAKATSEDGKIASGNPDESIQAVLMTLHWFDLDK